MTALTERTMPRLLTLELIREYYIPLGRSTLFRMISSGQFPAATKQMGRKVRLWDRDEIEAWVEERTTAKAKKGQSNVA
ncbi:MAG: helix-turn-helix transcriptional regulator [Tepidisphaeraceae bacterium]